MGRVSLISVVIRLVVFGLLGKVEVEQIVGNVYILTSVVGQVIREERGGRVREGGSLSL